MQFAIGTIVRERGKSQELTVVGLPGLVVSSVQPKSVKTMAGKLVCKWVDPNGKTIQRSFLESKLEFVRK